MEAHPILLQRKYTRVVYDFAQEMNIPIREALDFFYHSITYKDMSRGVSDMHCRSDKYLVEELKEEFPNLLYTKKKANERNDL